MKRLLIVLLFALAGFCLPAAAQDNILLVNGKTIKAIETTVENDVVSFRYYDERYGDPYFIERNKVAHIYFENGDHMDLTVAPRPGIVPGLSYDQIKDFYNPKYYKHEAGDMYLPLLSGLSSLLIPGLGQALNGEGGDAFLHFAGSLLIGYTTYKTLRISESPSSTPGKKIYNIEYSLSSLALLAAGISLNIYSFYNANRIAKVKNMYYQELRHGNPLTLHLSPYLAPSGAPFSNDLSAGLALRMEF